MGVFQDPQTGDWYMGPDQSGGRPDENLLSRGIVKDPLSDDYYQVPASSIQHWRRPEPIAAPQAPEPTVADGVGLADYAKSVMAGGAQLVQGVGWAARMLGADDVGGTVEELGREAVDYWNDGLSDPAKDALSREFVRKNEAGEWEWGDATLHTVGLFGAQSLLGTAAGAGTGAGVTKVLQAFANPVGRSVLQQAARSGSQQALKKLALVDRVIGAAGFGVGEGAVGSVTAGLNVYDRVMGMQPDELLSNPRYQQVFHSTDETMPELERHQYAAETIAREASSLAGLQAGLTTALLGAPAGAYFGGLFGRAGLQKIAGGRLKEMTVGAVGEGAQEFAQGAAEQVISNKALQGVGADVDTWEGVLNQALGGAIAGAPLGAALGAAGGGEPAKPGAKPEATKPKRHLEPIREAANAAVSKGADQAEVLKVVKAVADGTEPVLTGAGKLRKMAMGAPAATLAPDVSRETSAVEPRRLAKAVASGADQDSTLPDGGTLKTQYQLVDVDDLTTSHDNEGGVNPAFPQELQPRDRSRTASKQFVEEAAAKFQAAQMIEGVSAAGGPPVVDADGIVESGNGRTNLLRRVYETGRGDGYRGYLRTNAGKFGLSPEQVDQVKKPVLVRVRQQPMNMQERVEFTRRANQRPIAALSPSEQAKVDAGKIDDAALGRFNVPDDGNVLAPSNQAFVQSFLQGMPASERGGLMTADGAPTKQVADRIKAAVFSKAYGDDRLLALMAEEANPDVRNVVSALVTAAPSFAKTKAAGSTVNLTGPLVEGVDVLRKAKAAGQAVEEYLRQQGLFGSTSAEAGRFATFLDRNIRSGKRMSEALVAVADYAERAASGAKTQDIFGQPLPQTLDAALTAANQKLGGGKPASQSALFSRGDSVTDQVDDLALFGGNPDLTPDVADAPDYGRPSAPDEVVRSPIPPDLPQRQKAALMRQMGERSQPVAAKLLKGIHAALGGRGVYDTDVKTEKSLLGKGNRKGILQKRPWWNVEHVSDAFRFKSVLDNVNDLPAAVEALGRQARQLGITIEKADFGKFWSDRGLGNVPMVTGRNAATLAPVDAWGWRAIPFDLRMPNGLMAEYYITLPELAKANKAENHALFEKWRFRDLTDLAAKGGDDLKALRRDMTRSRKNYDDAVRA
jgi:hypothetical protein